MSAWDWEPSDSEVVDVGTFGIDRGEDDGDTDNSLAWADADAAGVPHFCPECGAALQHDSPDPDSGVDFGVVYCDAESDCGWPGMTY